MRTIDDYMGIKPFTVLVDDSPQLRTLAEKARALKALSFPEKLDAVKELALGSMENAYEQMIVKGREAEEFHGVDIIGGDGQVDHAEYETASEQHDKFTDIVLEEHPLSFALEQEAGCCRYQGALFFVLGFEAGLGDQHFVQAAPVNRRNTVFNEVVHDGEHTIVSIFTDSLKDKSLDYSRENPGIFEQAFEHMPEHHLFSYHKTPSGLVIVENPSQHVKTLGDFTMEPAYRLPFPETVEKKTSKPIGDFAHENFPQSRYAIDFLLPVGTPILAARAGRVFLTKQDSDNLHLDPQDLRGKTMDEIIALATEHTNLVAIQHRDGTLAEYLHLGNNSVSVKEGQYVNQGDLLGYTGMTGIMDAPHIHFNAFKMVDGNAISIPVAFAEPAAK